jgi:hypothetical protein
VGGHNPNSTPAQSFGALAEIIIEHPSNKSDIIMSNPGLIKKITDGIKKSGFPLELKIGNILERKNWDYSIGNIYKDFETDKYRESDIEAVKLMNGFAVHLFIECKKSEDKQIVLYAPKREKSFTNKSSWLKVFPKLRVDNNSKYSLTTVVGEFLGLKLYDKNIPIAKSIIVTKGDQVTQDNISYLSSINGLVKSSIQSGLTGPLVEELRCIYFHILIFDGNLFLLSNSKEDDFDLTEITYGQFEYESHFQFSSEHLSKNNDVIKASKTFGTNTVIEIVKPEKFEEYLDNLIDYIKRIDIEKLSGWGKTHDS